MNIYNNKVLLVIGGTRLITEAVVRHFLEQGVGQVRAFSGDVTLFPVTLKLLNR